MVRLLLVILAALLASARPAAADDGPRKLNVLFLISDDLRPELGCYGNRHVRTPNIDALASAGVRFDRAYCQFPLCNPSRTSVLTGRYPLATGVLDNTTWFGDAHPDFVSLPRLFKEHGYTTLRSGKVFHGNGLDDTEAWTEGGERRRPGGSSQATPSKTEGDESGRPAASKRSRAEYSDRIVVLEGDGEFEGDGAVAARAIDQLRRHKDGPFFLACGFVKPHSPPTAPKRFFDLYDVSEVPLPPDFAPRPTVPAGFPTPSIRRRNADLFIGRDATPEAAREMIRAYWASLTWVDHNVGRVLAELDRLGLRESTVIIFWGDHGYHLGEKGKWSKAGSLFEIGTRVPLIIAAPEARGNGRACPRVVQALDLYPTLCDLCGVPAPSGLQGQSLVPLLNDPTAPWDHPAYSMWAERNQPTGVAVRTERFRYVEWDGGKAGAMLLDLDADPHEQTNLADDPRFASIRQELSALAKQHADGAK